MGFHRAYIVFSAVGGGHCMPLCHVFHLQFPLHHPCHTNISTLTHVARLSCSTQNPSSFTWDRMGYHNSPIVQWTKPTLLCHGTGLFLLDIVLWEDWQWLEESRLSCRCTSRYYLTLQHWTLFKLVDDVVIFHTPTILPLPTVNATHMTLISLWSFKLLTCLVSHGTQLRSKDRISVLLSNMLVSCGTWNTERCP